MDDVDDEAEVSFELEEELEKDVQPSNDKQSLNEELDSRFGFPRITHGEKVGWLFNIRPVSDKKGKKSKS